MTVSLRKHLPVNTTITDDASVIVYCMLPNMVSGWYKGQKRVLFTMWETTKLPSHYYEELSQFDQIIVPCEHNRQVFLEYHDNVDVVPLGINPDLWKTRTPPKNDVFTFVTGGSNWWRKGIDIIVDAFVKYNNPNTRLVLKLSPDAYLSMPDVTLPPNVIMYKDWMSQQEEYDLYASADCFISASRGEGFGLIPLQAISMGLPTIISDMSGHSEFSHLANHPLPCQEVPIQDGHFQQVGLWYEVDTDDLIAAMDDHYTNREANQKKALANSVLAKEYTWERSAQRLVDVVGPGVKLEERVWEPALEAKVMIVCNRSVTADVNDRKYDFVKGEEYLVPVNVKRIIFEAGYLERTWMPRKK